MTRRDNPNYDIIVRHPDGIPSVDDILRLLVRSRLLDMTITDTVEEAPELQIKFKNGDLLLIERRLGADAFLEEGVNLTLQYGYFNEPNEERRLLSDPQTFTIKRTKATNEYYHIWGAPLMAKLLGAKMKPRVFDKQLVSSIVRRVFDADGFDKKHRIIQDTKDEVEGIIQHPNETDLAFVRRLAQVHNYLFYQTAHQDGTAILHFHKSGFERSSAEDVEIGRFTSGSKFGEKANGNTAPSQGVIVYRIEDAFRPFLDSSSIAIVTGVKSWNFANDPAGTPRTARALGIDLRNGKIVDQTVTQDDLNSLSLARKTVMVRAVDEDQTSFQVVEEMPVNTGGQSEKTAGDVAKAALEKSHGRIVQGQINFSAGDPRLQAGQIWTLIGFAKYSGDYLIRNVKHSFTGGGGYKTTINITSDGVDTPRAMETGRARKSRGAQVFVRSDKDQGLIQVVEEALE